MSVLEGLEVIVNYIKMIIFYVVHNIRNNLIFELSFNFLLHWASLRHLGLASLLQKEPHSTWRIWRKTPVRQHWKTLKSLETCRKGSCVQHLRVWRLGKGFWRRKGQHVIPQPHARLQPCALGAHSRPLDRRKLGARRVPSFSVYILLHMRMIRGSVRESPQLSHWKVG